MADSMLLAGVLTITIDGTPYNIVGEGAYRLSANHRETLKGQDTVHGFSESVMEGKISFKGRDSSRISITDVNNLTNSTVVFALANGKTIIGRNMWRTGDPIEVATEDASFSVEFDGPDVSEN